MARISKTRAIAREWKESWKVSGQKNRHLFCHLKQEIEILPFRASPTVLGAHMLGERAKGMEFPGGKKDGKRYEQL